MNTFTAFLERSITRRAADAAASKKGGRQAGKKSAKEYHVMEFRKKLELGSRIAQFYEEKHGGESLRILLRKINPEEEDFEPWRRKFPWGFWKEFIETEMCMMFNDARRMHCARCFDLHVGSLALGGDSTISRLNGLRRHAKKRRGGERNALKCESLGWHLLQYFVDEMQVLRSRMDSTMLINKAIELRRDIAASGLVAEKTLPSLEPRSCAQSWFRRWRGRYNIKAKKTGMQMKVSWRKICSRTRTLMTNIWRLRALWRLVHSDKEMRFLSMDQKPSWFNNAGHTHTYSVSGGKPCRVNENFAQTRQRYTILTVVPSWTQYMPAEAAADNPPPDVFVLFKAKKDGRVQKDLDEFSTPPWLHTQVQQLGSYREEDVLDALHTLLPAARDSTESMVVLLDYFSAHLTHDVQQFIAERGHVVLYHGGGTTAFTQINDTHLHAQLQSCIIKLENQVSHEMRRDMWMNCNQGVATLTRHDVLRIVEVAWKLMNHKSIAAIGYEQTGPNMPFDGPILRSQVATDLLDVLHEIDPPIGDQEVGTSLRDEAKEFVQAGWPQKWSCWEHASRLILEQDTEDDPLPEGCEALGYYVARPDDDDDDDNDGDSEDEAERSGSEMDTPGPTGASEPAADNKGISSAAGHVGPVDGLHAHGSSASSAPCGLEEARERMIAHYRQTRNDLMLKKMLTEKRQEACADKVFFGCL